MSATATRHVDPAWFPTLTPADRHVARLICLPYAGGGSPLFRPWREHLSPSLQICPIELPGRWGRVREQPYCDLVALADAIAERVALLSALPTVIFGYSYGALLAYELAHRLLAHHGIAVRHLFVAARRAPHLRDPGPPMHTLSDDAFQLAVERTYEGGLDPALLRDRDMAALLLRVLRADIEAVETYEHEPRPALPCSITAFGGREDSTATPAQIDEWARHTAGSFSTTFYDGGHFFVRTHWRSMLAEIDRVCAAFEARSPA
ncbi:MULTISPECIES: thioesterase II family protein [Sandaracinus]|uniref:thioesterase II family protein n=1 Tax=Sandaracinus TaxID=1055688 RepID=UPI0019D44394|nr:MULTISPECIES: alpha/beta fold hydrolase [Sandaracinus]QRN75763.1 Thioesterase [Sandaracinus sp.]UJR87263.1 Surfactin synthase thioesterase subunit [Sandaracinus amylolyticus]